MKYEATNPTTRSINANEPNRIPSTTREDLECTLMSADMDAKILLCEGEFSAKWSTILDDDGEHVLECALVPVYVGDEEQFRGEEFPFLVEIAEPREGDTFTSDELDEIWLRVMSANECLETWERELPWVSGVGDVDGDALWIAGQNS